MRYKTTQKILIDKRKLDTLIRLDCPKEILIDLIFENKLTLTGDSLIDDNLESLLEIKEFENWGGSRKGSGRLKKNQLENQDENQDENQLENQDAFQVGDKDKDKDYDKDKDIDKDISFKEDVFFDKNIQKVISLYKEHCKRLIPIKFEHRTRERLIEIREFLKVVGLDFSYVIDLMDRANKQKVFYENKINLKSLIKNHAEIYSGLGGERPQGNTNSQTSTADIVAKVRARKELQGSDT